MNSRHSSTSDSSCSRAIGHAALPVLAILAGCGPAAIGAGIGELGDTGARTTIVLLIVNDGDEAIEVVFTGSGADGIPLELRSQPVPPGTIANVEAPRVPSLRVRATGTQRDLATPPVTWDFRIDGPTDQTRLELAPEAAVWSGLLATSTTTDRLALDRLVGEAGTASFARIGGGSLPAPCERIAVHPGGSRVYTVRDLGAGTAELTAFRIDACSGALEIVAPENGSAPVNPRTFSQVGDLAGLSLFVEPMGRQLYSIQRIAAGSTSIVDVWPILADGSLGAPETIVRGLVGSVAARPDGRRLYWSEDLGDGRGFVLRDFLLDEDGRIDFAAGEALMPCVATQGGRFALHPSGRFVYAAFTDPDPPPPAASLVRVGAYFIGDNAGIVQVDRSCDAFATLVDLEVDPQGTELRASGTLIGGATRVLRFAIDAVTGSLGAMSEQDLGDASRLAATDDPARSMSDPLRRMVHVAIGDRLVPHQRLPDGSLQPLPGGAALEFGSTASTSFVQGLRRGRAAVVLPR